MAEANLTPERLRALIDYDRETGVVTWRVNNRRARAGATVGSKTQGYLIAKIDGTLHRVHRLIWMFIHGVPPVGQIDHIDGDRMNNAINNLRDVTASTNKQNQRKPYSNSKSGLLGVTWHARDKRWLANIRKPGMKRATEVGRFHTPEEASAAYLRAKREFHAGCTI